MMKRIVVSAILIMALCLTVGLMWADERKAPDFRLKNITGEMVHFYDQLGDGPILVDFWATWCIPCMQEMEQFQKLYEKYHEDGFEIFGISVDNPRSSSKIKPTVASKGWTFPILLDPDKEVLKKFGGKQKIPYLVVVSPDGDIIAIHEGYKAGNEKVIEAEILPFIGDPDAGGDETEELESTTE